MLTLVAKSASSQSSSSTNRDEEMILEGWGLEPQSLPHIMWLSYMQISIKTLVLLVIGSSVIGAAIFSAVMRFRKTHAWREVVNIISGLCLLAGMSLALLNNTSGFMIIFFVSGVLISVEVGSWLGARRHRKNTKSS